MINFDALPTTSPYGIPEPGFYKGKIIKAEMKPAFNKADPDELNITYELTKRNGEKETNKLFDKLKDSDKPAQLFKIGRFCRAIDLKLTGNVELKDLAKLIVGKELIVDVEHSEYQGKKRAQVSMFNHECYYKVSEWDTITDPFAALETDDDDELPFVTGAESTTEEDY